MKYTQEIRSDSHLDLKIEKFDQTFILILQARLVNEEGG